MMRENDFGNCFPPLSENIVWTETGIRLDVNKMTLSFSEYINNLFLCYVNKLIFPIIETLVLDNLNLTIKLINKMGLINFRSNLNNSCYGHRERKWMELFTWKEDHKKNNQFAKKKENKITWKFGAICESW